MIGTIESTTHLTDTLLLARSMIVPTYEKTSQLFLNQPVNIGEREIHLRVLLHYSIDVNQSRNAAGI